MQIFGGVGLSEIIFVLILMVILLGPRKMVEGARNLGKAIRKVTHSQFWKDVVQTSKEIEEFPKKIMDETELEEKLRSIEHDIKKDSDESVSGLTRSPEFKPPQGKKEKPDKPKNP
jgi:Sec-independent protein translocase protein TatA